MEKIDVYDFDKTLYKKDSTVQFYIFCLRKNKSIIKYLPFQIINFILYKLKIVKKVVFKERFFVFLKLLKNVDQYVDEFWKLNEKYIRKNILEKSNNPKYVISASPEFLLEKICNSIGIDKLIASKVDKNTGEFLSENCYGEEKVNRLKEEDKNFKIENFYTDSITDKFLANISEKSYLITKGGIKEWRVKIQSTNIS